MKLPLFLILTAFLFTGCASNSSETTASTSTDSNDKVSNVPWNKPQSWEGTGQLGGAINQGRY